MTSTSTQLSEAEFDHLLESIQQQFDAVVDSGSDQELFIFGYLSGHFSLVASQCCLNGLRSLAQLNEQLLLSLEGAFANGELEADDQAQVLAGWQSLVNAC